MEGQVTLAECSRARHRVQYRTEGQASNRDLTAESLHSGIDIRLPWTRSRGWEVGHEERAALSPDGLWVLGHPDVPGPSAYES